MERMLYLVAPTNDQCNSDEDGVVNQDLFVWATDASEAVKLWREYFEMDAEDTTSESKLGLDEHVRVFEVPIMPAGAPSAVVGWDDIHTYSATITERSES
ncbi:UNVERIFIED_ORG: hypothetical protein M2193_000122 [Bradyrhizobium japonicum]